MKSSASVKMSVDEEAEVLATLRAMEADEKYNTPSRYSSNTALYPNNLITFSALHIAYIRKYPETNPQQYLQNLKMITKVR